MLCETEKNSTIWAKLPLKEKFQIESEITHQLNKLVDRLLAGEDGYDSAPICLLMCNLENAPLNTNHKICSITSFKDTRRLPGQLLIAHKNRRPVNIRID